MLSATESYWPHVSHNAAAPKDRLGLPHFLFLKAYGSSSQNQGTFLLKAWGSGG